MRTQPRKRRAVPRGAITALSPILRFSKRRNAYILRGVGNRLGPVLVVPSEDPDRLNRAR